MTLAVVLGTGPDVDAFLSQPQRHPDGCYVCAANVSWFAPKYNGRRLPRLNVFDPDRTIRSLRTKGISSLIAVGSMRLTNPRILKWKTAPLYGRTIMYKFRGEDPSDPIRTTIGSLISQHVELPPLRMVL